MISCYTGDRYGTLRGPPSSSSHYDRGMRTPTLHRLSPVVHGGANPLLYSGNNGQYPAYLVGLHINPICFFCVKKENSSENPKSLHYLKIRISEIEVS